MPVPTDEELQEFIEDALSAKLDVIDKAQRRFERRRRNVLTVLTVFFIPATIAATLWFGTDGAGANFEFSSAWGVPLAMIAIFAAVYAGIRVRFLPYEIPFEYEPDVIAPLISYLDPRLGYRPKNRFSPSQLESSELFGASVCALDCGAYFEGKIRSIGLCFGEVKATIEKRSEQGGSANSQFEGLFLVAEYEGKFDGRAVVVASRGREIWNVDVGLEPIDFDGEQWADKLDIYGSSSEAARALLRTPVGERIARVEAPFFFAVMDDRLLLAQQMPRYFQRPPDLPITDTAHLHRVGRQLSAVIDLVEYMEMVPVIAPGEDD